MLMKNVDIAFVDHALTSYINEFTVFLVRYLRGSEATERGWERGVPLPR